MPLFWFVVVEEEVTVKCGGVCLKHGKPVLEAGVCAGESEAGQRTLDSS